MRPDRLRILQRFELRVGRVGHAEDGRVEHAQSNQFRRNRLLGRDVISGARKASPASFSKSSPFVHLRNVKGDRNRSPFDFSFYFAYSMALVSRSRCTLICPDTPALPRFFLAISRASSTIRSSLTCSGFTMMRTSRPAWMALGFTPRPGRRK